jgi:hypothetical protein
MIRWWIEPLCCVGALTACTEKLSMEEADLLDAMIFVSDDIEDHTKEDIWPEPWRRQIVGRTIEYSRRARNNIGSSDEAENKKIRDSLFIRYVETISSPEPCVFLRDSSMSSRRATAR